MITNILLNCSPAGDVGSHSCALVQLPLSVRRHTQRTQRDGDTDGYCVVKQGEHIVFPAKEKSCCIRCVCLHCTARCKRSGITSSSAFTMMNVSDCVVAEYQFRTVSV